MPVSQAIKMLRLPTRVKQDMLHSLAGSSVCYKRLFDSFFNLIGIMILVEHQYADKVFNAFCISLLLDK